MQCINLNRTFPTTYVAYSPFLVQETARSKPVAKCVTQTTAIPLPGTATAQLVFPQTDRNPTPGFASVFALLDSLPTVSAMLNGGDPADCFQGQPATTSALVITAPPEIPPAMVSVYTTVSVLTHVGDPVTLAPDPLNGAAGAAADGARGAEPRAAAGGPHRHRAAGGERAAARRRPSRRARDRPPAARRHDARRIRGARGRGGRGRVVGRSAAGGRGRGDGFDGRAAPGGFFFRFRGGEGDADGRDFGRLEGRVVDHSDVLGVSVWWVMRFLTFFTRHDQIGSREFEVQEYPDWING